MKETWEVNLKEACLAVPNEEKDKDIILKIKSFLRERMNPRYCSRCLGDFYPDPLSTDRNKLCPECRAKKGKCDLDNLMEQARTENLRLHIGDHELPPSQLFWLTFGKEKSSPNSVKRLRQLPYEVFLVLPYWKIIKNYVLFRHSYKCVICESTESLNVHHKTYIHHGEEHKHLNDLAVLCRKCHAKFHDKLPKPVWTT